MGAIAREYGVVFPVLAIFGFVICGRGGNDRVDTPAAPASKVPWRTLLLATVPLSVIWPARAFVLTGNPVYSLPIGSLPTNHLFVSWIEATAAAFGPTLRSATTWGNVLRYVTAYAPAAVIGWFALGWLARRGQRLALFAALACVVVFELWLASIPYTNGGLFYTMRVTSPALALGALVGGCVLAQARFRAWATVAVAAIAILTLPAALLLPQNPWIASSWQTPTATSAAPAEDSIVTLIRSRGWKGPIVSDASGYQKLLAPAGVVVVPLWSPGATCLIDPELTAADAAERWRASGLRQVIVTNNPVNRAYFAAHAHWGKPPFRTRVLGTFREHILLEIDAGP